MSDAHADLRARLAPLPPDDADLEVIAALVPAVDGLEQLLASIDLDDV